MTTRRLSGQADQVRHVAEWLASECIHYEVLGTTTNRDKARTHIGRMRALLDEIEQTIALREQSKGREKGGER